MERAQNNKEIRDEIESQDSLDKSDDHDVSGESVTDNRGTIFIQQQMS